MVTTEELLQREQEAWAAFIDAVGTVSQDRREEPGVVPGWSLHDMVWHCGYWAGYVVDVFDKLARGESTDDDHDWDAADAKVIEDGRAMSWEQVVTASEGNRERVRAALSSLPKL